MQHDTDIWSYRNTEKTAGGDIAGFTVEALDGSIGKVDEATYEVGSSMIVVDTGPWIFGKKVLLPAGVVELVDSSDEKVYVNRTKDEIKHAPEVGDVDNDETYRTRLGEYYDRGGAGWRDSAR